MSSWGCEKLSGAVSFCTVRTTLKHTVRAPRKAVAVLRTLPTSLLSPPTAVLTTLCWLGLG